MTTQSISNIGQGGAGLDTKLGGILKELQGLNVTLVTGGAANAALSIPAIRPEDTLISVTQFADAGGATDQTSDTSISDLNATGTLTLTSLVEGNTAVVRGKTYTFKAVPDVLVYTDVQLAGTDAANAANLAAAINRFEGSQGLALVAATAAGNVVTVRAVNEGTAANSYTLVGTASKIAVSGATLSGGAASGSIKITNSTASSKVQVIWFNKQ